MPNLLTLLKQSSPQTETLARKHAERVGVSLSEYIADAVALKVSKDDVAYYGQLAKFDILRGMAIDKATDDLLGRQTTLTDRTEAERYVVASGSWYTLFDFEALAYDAPPFTTQDEWEYIASKRVSALAPKED